MYCSFLVGFVFLADFSSHVTNGCFRYLNSRSFHSFSDFSKLLYSYIMFVLLIYLYSIMCIANILPIPVPYIYYFGLETTCSSVGNLIVDRRMSRKKSALFNRFLSPPTPPPILFCPSLNFTLFTNPFISWHVARHFGPERTRLGQNRARTVLGVSR